MILILRSVAPINPLQVEAELTLINGQHLDHARLFHEVEGEQRQGYARSGICQRKDVKMPAVLSFLQLRRFCC